MDKLATDYMRAYITYIELMILKEILQVKKEVMSNGK